MMDEYINYMVKLGVDHIPHLEGDLLSHCMRVAGMLYSSSSTKSRAGEQSSSAGLHPGVGLFWGLHEGLLSSAVLYSPVTGSM